MVRFSNVLLSAKKLSQFKTTSSCSMCESKAVWVEVLSLLLTYFFKYAYVTIMSRSMEPRTIIEDNKYYNFMIAYKSIIYKLRGNSLKL